MDIRLLQVAEQELDEAVEYYNGERPGLGRDFLLEFLNSLERIKTYPETWHSFSTGTRRCQMRRFPYGIVYQITEKEILVLAVAHLHRRPEYWKTRLQP